MKKTKFLLNGAFLVCSGLLIKPHSSAQSFIGPEIDPFAIANLELEIAKISFVDLDGDGDQDCFQANYYDNAFIYQENTGTESAPNYVTSETNPFGLSPTTPSFAPVFVDIDADGDFDLFTSSEEDGTVFYYENSGSATVPEFGSEEIAPFGLTFIYSVLGNLIDIDNDGDFDVFGAIFLEDTEENKIFMAENIGTTEAPEFSAPIADPFGISLTTTDFFYFMDFADLDQDGDLDLMRSEYENSSILYHENIGTADAPEFEPGDGIASPFGIADLGGDLFFLIPSFVDIDGDSDMDLFVPSAYYTDTSIVVENYFYENRTVVAGLSDNNFEAANFNVFPNPATTNLSLFSSSSTETIESVRILAVDGREVFRSSRWINQIDLTDFTPGVYIVELGFANENKQQLKFIKN
jgi:hypothetical protein